MATETQTFVEEVTRRGWASTGRILDEAEVRELRHDVAPYAVDGRGGARNLLSNGRIRALATADRVRRFAAAVLGEECFAVRALLFDKTPTANWKVVWHQDLTIAVRQQVHVPGYGPWSEKAGVPHVQPSVAVLEEMLALRVHLDSCTAANGPVRVIERSHRVGRLSAAAIDEVRQSGAEHECLAEEGEILAFRPLLLHASAPAIAPGHRRVVHIEYASQPLPFPLQWNERVA